MDVEVGEPHGKDRRMDRDVGDGDAPDPNDPDSIDMLPDDSGNGDETGADLSDHPHEGSHAHPLPHRHGHIHPHGHGHHEQLHHHHMLQHAHHAIPHPHQHPHAHPHSHSHPHGAHSVMNHGDHPHVHVHPHIMPFSGWNSQGQGLDWHSGAFSDFEFPGYPSHFVAPPPHSNESSSFITPQTPSSSRVVYDLPHPHMPHMMVPVSIPLFFSFFSFFFATKIDLLYRLRSHTKNIELTPSLPPPPLVPPSLFIKQTPVAPPPSGDRSQQENSMSLEERKVAARKRQRDRNPMQWVRNNYNRKRLKEKGSCSCAMRCFDHVSASDRNRMRDRFLRAQTKKEENAVLSEYMVIQAREIKGPRRSNGSHGKSSSHSGRLSNGGSVSSVRNQSTGSDSDSESQHLRNRNSGVHHLNTDGVVPHIRDENGDPMLKVGDGDEVEVDVRVHVNPPGTNSNRNALLKKEDSNSSQNQQQHSSILSSAQRRPLALSEDENAIPPPPPPQPVSMMSSLQMMDPDDIDHMHHNGSHRRHRDDEVRDDEDEDEDDDEEGKRLHRTNRLFRVTYIADVRSDDGKTATHMPICHFAFMSIFGVGKRRVSSLASHIFENGTIPVEDGRGKHKSRFNRTPDDMVELAREHILGFPRAKPAKNEQQKQKESSRIETSGLPGVDGVPQHVLPGNLTVISMFRMFASKYQPVLLQLEKHVPMISNLKKVNRRKKKERLMNDINDLSQVSLQASISELAPLWKLLTCTVCGASCTKGRDNLIPVFYKSPNISSTLRTKTGVLHFPPYQYMIAVACSDQCVARFTDQHNYNGLDVVSTPYKSILDIPDNAPLKDVFKQIVSRDKYDRLFRDMNVAFLRKK